MDPAELLAPPSAQGAPAPFAILQTLKLVGFVLHMGPMHLWYAGLTLAAALSLGSRSPHGQRVAARLGKAIPIAIALGINLGLVPLLFTQVTYHRAVYPTGILMAWPWFAVIPLLLGSYAATYWHAAQLKSGVRRSGRVALTAAAAGFLLIGFLFANHFSLLTNMGGWEAIHQQTSVSGAVTGLALNTSDPSLWPRWLMFWCLALTTTGVWVAADTVLLAKHEAAGYRAWALRCGLVAYGLGGVGFAGCGAWYLSTVDPALHESLQSSSLLFVATGVAPLAVLGLLAFVARRPSRQLAFGLLASQAIVLLLNALSRQTLQLAKLRSFGYDPAAAEVNFELSPFVLFLLGTALGVGVMVWMLRSVHRDLTAATPAAESGAAPPARAAPESESNAAPESEPSP